MAAARTEHPDEPAICSKVLRRAWRSEVFALPFAVAELRRYRCDSIPPASQQAAAPFDCFESSIHWHSSQIHWRSHDFVPRMQGVCRHATWHFLVQTTVPTAPNRESPAITAFNRTASPNHALQRTAPRVTALLTLLERSVRARHLCPTHRCLPLRSTFAATAPRSAVAELGVVRRFPRP